MGAFSFVTPSEFVNWPCWIECDCHARVSILFDGSTPGILSVIEDPVGLRHLLLFIFFRTVFV